MARFGSRAKGKVGEREVAKLVQAWWAEVEPGCEFAPTPLSGGWNKASMRGGMKMSGDLCTTAGKFPFVIEVKRREKWNLERLLAGRASPVIGWWRQCCKAAKEQGGMPLLVFRKNREPWRYMVLGDENTLVVDSIVIDGQSVAVGLLDDLLADDPKEFL